MGTPLTRLRGPVGGCAPILLEELPGEVDVEGADVDVCDADAGVGNELNSALGPRGGAFPDMTRKGGWGQMVVAAVDDDEQMW